MATHYSLEKKKVNDVPQDTFSEHSSENLSQMEKMAAIGQLSSSVAHEMRNLMGMIRTAAFNIDRAVNTSDTVTKNNLEIITRSVTRAREFIDNLLDLSRIPKGTVELIDVRTISDSLLNLFSKELEWRKIKLVRDYQPVALIHVDRNILQECMLNLILNAIQSMDEGGEITVQIRPWQEGIQIAVRDTGCGIPADKLEQIFDRFFTTKQNGMGTGLGLSIVKSLAAELGGSISVESEVNKGSCFYINLPDKPREKNRSNIKEIQPKAG